MSGWVRILGLLVAFSLLAGPAACSRSDEPAPGGLAGLAFGDPPGQGLTPVPVVLPSGLAGALTYYTRPGPAAAFRGVALVDPVFAFHDNRLCSVVALLGQPAEAPRLRRELETAYGPPFCRESAGRASCLWRLDGVEVVLESGGGGAARLTVRSRPLVAAVDRWRGQDVPLEGGDAGQ